MRDNLLIVAHSGQDANMLYVARMPVPEPFVYLQIRQRSALLVHDCDSARARRDAPHCRVICYEEVCRGLKREGIDRPDLAQVIRSVLRRSGIRKVTVPENFPLGLAKQLQKLRVKVRPKVGAFFESRETKSSDEVRKISAALTMAEVGLAEAIHAIKNARIGKNRRLIYRNAPLTGEKLQGIMATAVLQAGGTAASSLVSLGGQSHDPRERAHGIVRSGEPIILNVMPRSQKTGYFGDLTRTVVKGKASEAVRQMYRVVEEAQDLTFGLLRDGASAGQIHGRILEFFTSSGYRTGRKNGRNEGLLHGVGHGLGLEAREELRLECGSEHRVRSGHVVTVEPGLYYPGVGGVRLEDVALVTRGTAKNLTRFEKVLEI